ncbi:MAG: hypothetical protein ACJAZX_000523 [Rickettsiales bacterium]|jgi:hypothetical protein
MLRNKKYISLFFIFLLLTNFSKAGQSAIFAKYDAQNSDENYETGNNLENDNSWKNLTLPYFSQYEQSNNDRPNFDKYDFQTSNKNSNKDKFVKDKSEIDNSTNRQFSVRKEWFNETQAFDRSAGESFTLPYRQEDSNIDQIRTNRDLIGDLILTTPIEYKINRGDITSGVSLTPSILLPNGNSSADEGNVNFGISVAY